MKNTDVIKSIGFTFLISALAFLAMYFIKIEKKIIPETVISEPKKENLAKDSLAKTEDSLFTAEIFVPENNLADTTNSETTIIPVPIIAKKETTAKEEKKEKITEKSKEKSKNETQKEAEKKLTDTKKTSTKEKTTTKEEKPSNFVTVSYVIDKDGKFTTAQRIEGLRDRASINKAISYVKKNIKGKKGKETKGTYVYKF